MPRRKQPIAAELSGPLVEFAQGLRELRALAADPPYSEMARKGLASKSVLSAADNGREMPTWEVTRAYVTACGGDLDEWQKRWKETRDQIRKPSTDAVIAEPVPPAVRPAAPRPVTALDPKGFQEALRLLYVWAGSPSYRVLANRASEKSLILARSTISDMLCPRKSSLPTTNKLVSYLTVCMLPADQHGEWLAVRKAIASDRGRDRGRSLAEAHTPVDPAGDEPMVRVPGKNGKKVSWQSATADLPVIQPLRDQAWSTLPEPVARQLYEQLEQLQKGEDVVEIFVDDPAGAGGETRKVRETQISAVREKQWPWTSGPPVIVSITLVLVLITLVVVCVYILMRHAG